MAEENVVPIEKGRTSDEFVELGSSGLQSAGGYVAEHNSVPDLATPERARRIYSEMADNDATVGGILFSVDMLMRQVEWNMNPADVDKIEKYAIRKAQEAAASDPNADPNNNVIPLPGAATPVMQPGYKPPVLTPLQKEAQRYADFGLSCMEDMSSSWEDVLSQGLTMLPFGWSYHEIVYKRRLGPEPGNDLPESKHNDGLIGWRKIAQRDQDTIHRWEIDEDGGIRGMWQAAPPRYEPVFIPIEKSLLFRTTAKHNNPEGRSILRNAYRAWYMKKRIEEIEGIGIERDLAGLPVMYVPSKLMHAEATTEQKMALEMFKKIVKNVKRDQNEGVILPHMVDDKGNRMVELTLLSTEGRRQFDTDSIIARYDQRIAMSVLADFILLGHEKVGSYSLGASKIDLFSMALGAWLDTIADVFNNHALPRLMKLNGFPPELTPTLTHSNIESIDLDALGKYLGALTTAGIPLVTDPETENYLRRAGGMPERDASEELT